MKSIVPHKWVIDKKISILTSLVLLRNGVCKDIRLYIQKYLYEYKCESDDVFYAIKKWTDEEIDIYERVQLNRETTARIDNITHLLLGLIYTYTYFGKHVVMLCNEYNYQVYIIEYLKKLINKIYIKYSFLNYIKFVNGSSISALIDLSDSGNYYHCDIDLLICEYGMTYDVKYKCILFVNPLQLQFDWYYYDEVLINNF